MYGALYEYDYWIYRNKIVKPSRPMRRAGMVCYVLTCHLLIEVIGGRGLTDLTANPLANLLDHANGVTQNGYFWFGIVHCFHPLSFQGLTTSLAGVVRRLKLEQHQMAFFFKI